MMLSAALLGAAILSQTGCAPATLENGRLWTTIAVNGVETEALLDTGAEMTLLDSAFAGRIEAGEGASVDARGTGAGTVEARFVPGLTLSLAGQDMEAVTAVAIDLTDVSQRLIGAPLQAVAGREFFDRHRVRIDFEAGTVCVIARETAPDGERFELTERAGIMGFPVTLEGHEVIADLDTGNRGALLLSRDGAEAAGLYDGRPVASESGGGLGGAVELDALVIEEIRIGSQVHEDVEALVDRREGEAHANIGLALLSHYTLTIDFSENALWLEPR